MTDDALWLQQTEHGGGGFSVNHRRDGYVPQTLRAVPKQTSDTPSVFSGGKRFPERRAGAVRHGAGG
jgi:hypothetical protein